MKYFKYLVFIISGILFFSFLGRIDLWDPDEPRYVEIAREMISLKQYLIPHLNSQIYAHKPPLFFWAIAFFFKTFNSYSEFIARLTPAISGLLIVILTYFYSKKIFNNLRIGVFSAIVISTNVSMVHLSRRANIDTFFTLFILISIIFLHFYIEKRKNFYIYISGIFQGIATLIKGPLGFIIPFLTFASFLIITNDKENLKKVPWIKTLIVIFGIISLWIIPSWVYGGDEYIKQLIIKHVFKRYAEGVNHPRSFFYYFYIFPLDFLPWSVFIPYVFKKIFSPHRKIDKKLIWFLCYFFVNFIFLCFSKEKRGLYLLPLYPAMSVLYGYVFAENFHGNEKFFKYPYFFITTIIGLLSLGCEIYYFYKTGKVNPYLTVITAFSFWISFFSLKYIKSIITLYFASAGLIFSIYSFIFPLFNPLKSPKIFIKNLVKITKNIDNVLFFRYINPGFNFYLKKDRLNFSKNEKDLENFKYIVMKYKEFRKGKINLKDFSIIYSRKLGHRKLILLKKHVGE